MQLIQQYFTLQLVQIRWLPDFYTTKNISMYSTCCNTYHYLVVICSEHLLSGTIHWNYLVGEKLANLANHGLFAKIFLTNIHRYTENVYGICTDCRLLVKFSSPIAFTCTVCQNFPLPNISCVHCIIHNTKCFNKEIVMIPIQCLI